MPEVHAQLPDGTILAFPDGTDPSIIDGAVKQHLGTQQIPPTNAAGKIQSTRPAVHNLPPPSPEVLSGQSTTKPVSPQDIASLLKVPGSVSPAIDVGTTVASMTPGGPIPKAIAGIGAGTASYLGLHSLLARLAGEDESMGAAAKDLLINEVGGRVIGMGMKGLTAAQQEMSKLSPTFSQYFKNNVIPKAIEDLFAPTTKAAAIKNSGAAASDLVSQEAQELSKSPQLPQGRFKSTVDNPEFYATVIKDKNLKSAINSSFTESDKQANLSKLIAKTNPEIVTLSPAQTVNVPTPELQGLSQQLNRTSFEQASPGDQQKILQFAQSVRINPFITQNIPAVTKTVEGPVQLSNVLQKAYGIVKDSEKYPTLGVPDEQKPLAAMAQDLIKSTNAKFDPTGKLVSANPAGFEEAWAKKQSMDDLGGWNKSKNDITNTDRQFRGLTSSLNDDIEASLAQWKNDPKQLALKAWQNSKATVAQRNALFYPQDSSTRLGDIIESSDSPMPALNQVLDDPNKLQTALNSGNIKFPSGTVAANNMKQDMAAYNLKRMWNSSVKLDDLDPTKLNVNTSALQNAWNDPATYEQRNLLYNSQTRSNYAQLFKNIAMTQQKTMNSWVPKVAAVRGGLMLATGLLTGTITHSLETGAATIGVELGMSAIAKAMANPDTARILVAAAAGQPLNMSQQMAARKLMSVIQGATVTFVGKDGTKEQGSFDREGKFSPTESPQPQSEPAKPQ